MKCLYCNGKMEQATSTYTVDRKGYHLFIKDIPAYVCSRCGEKHFEEEEVGAIQNVIKNLEAEIEKIRRYKKVS